MKKKKSNRTEVSSTKEVASIPETKFFEVASSLKSVFDNTERPFSLFGGHSEPNEPSNDAAAAADDEDDEVSDSDDEDIAVPGKLIKLMFLKCLQL